MGESEWEVVIVSTMVHHKVLLYKINSDKETAEHEGDVDVLDVDVEDGAVFGILSHGALGLQHDVLRAFG